MSLLSAECCCCWIFKDVGKAYYFPITNFHNFPFIWTIFLIFNFSAQFSNNNNNSNFFLRVWWLLTYVMFLRNYSIFKSISLTIDEFRDFSRQFNHLFFSLISFVDLRKGFSNIFLNKFSFIKFPRGKQHKC